MATIIDKLDAAIEAVLNRCKSTNYFERDKIELY